MVRTCLILALAALLPALADAQSCAARSIRWEKDGVEHRTVIEPRTRNGCPVLTQTLSRSGATLTNATGVDCDCNLLIDGKESLFSPPNPLVAGRMTEACRANKASATQPEVYLNEPAS